jgi:hypothetical protein
LPASRFVTYSLAIVILTIFGGGGARSQIPATPQEAAEPQSAIDTATPSLGTKLLYLGGASLLFSGFDYFGYNLTRRNPSALIVYRVLQVLTQGAITWFLYDKMGLPTAVSFNVLWWTFCCDFLYYGYAEVINPGHPWESRGDLRNGVFRNDATWAYWTPVGISRGMKRDKGIPGETLVAQSLVGLALALTITITF